MTSDGMTSDGVDFAGELFEWRGPSPFHFVAVPDDEADLIRQVAALASYGWGVIPVSARIGRTSFTTSLFPKDGGYLLPVKDAVRRGERIAIGDTVRVRMEVDMARARRRH